MSHNRHIFYCIKLKRGQIHEKRHQSKLFDSAIAVLTLRKHPLFLICDVIIIPVLEIVKGFSPKISL